MIVQKSKLSGSVHLATQVDQMLPRHVRTEEVVHAVDIGLQSAERRVHDLLAPGRKENIRKALGDRTHGRFERFTRL